MNEEIDWWDVMTRVRVPPQDKPLTSSSKPAGLRGTSNVVGHTLLWVMRNIVPPVVTLVVGLLALGAVRQFGDLPTYILPELRGVVSSLWVPTMPNDFRVTITEILVGLAIGTALGVITALLVASSRYVERGVMPWMAFFQNVPKIVLGPLFVIWFGFGLLPKLLLVIALTYFPVLVTMVAGLRSADPDMVDLVRGLGGSRWLIFRKVRIPSSIPSFFSGFKLATTVAPIGAIVGEWLGADAGLGYRLIVAQSRLDPNLLFAVVLVIAVVGLVLYQAAHLAETLVLRWHAEEKDIS